MATQYYIKPQSLVRKEDEDDFTVRKICDDIVFVGAGGSSAVPNYTIGDPDLVKVNNIIKLNFDGSIDDSFNIVALFDGNSRVALQSDGKIVNGKHRLNANGTEDNSFIIASGLNREAVAVQYDDKIIVGGSQSGCIARFNSDGSLDESFNIGTGFDDIVRAIAIQDDGKILVGGDFTTYNGESHNRIIRLNDDGSADESFNLVGNGITNDPFSGDSPQVYSISIKNSGMVIAGRFENYNGSYYRNIVKTDMDGIPDETFDTATSFNGVVYNTFTQDDGKILCIGGFTSYNSVSYNRIIRLNTDGSVDNTFNIGTGLNQQGNIIKKNNDDIFIGGNFSTYNGSSSGGIARLDNNGSLNINFDSGLGFHRSNITGSIQSIVIDNNKLIVSGDFYAYQGSILYNGYNKLSINRKRELFTTLNLGSGFNNAVRTSVVQDDGKIILGGSFTTYNGISKTRIVRLNEDGSIDNSFDIGSGFNNQVVDIAIRDDGKILVGGYFTTYKGVSANRIIQLNSDGSKDSSFDIGTGVTSAGSVEVIRIQDDDKIIIGGVFNYYRDTISNNIARINTDGSIDSSFLAAGLFSGATNDIDIMSDGKIVVANTYFTAASSNPIIILDSNGSFYDDPLIGETYIVNSIKILSDDSILLGYNSRNDNMLIKKLNADGSVSASFYSGIFKSDDSIYKILVQSDNKIIILGSIRKYDNNPIFNFVRLYSDGTFDDTIDFGIKGAIYTLLLVE